VRSEAMRLKSKLDNRDLKQFITDFLDSGVERENFEDSDMELAIYKVSDMALIIVRLKHK
jgi:hypothetical protein